MIFACIFTGFAESRPWECRVFSFKIARTSQTSRVFPFTFAHSGRKSHVLYVFCLYVADICVILCLCVAVCGRQFPSRVDTLMQFYGVFWEPFMGMSCFLVQKWVRVIKVSCFSVQFCSQLSPISCFASIFAYFVLIFQIHKLSSGGTNCNALNQCLSEFWPNSGPFLKFFTTIKNRRHLSKVVQDTS